jgi:uncharacterized protein
MHRLDPRAPLVIDTRELGRRPGSMRKLSRTVPAPADLGIDVLSVPEGTDLGLDLRLEAVMEGVLVSGTARGRLRGECVRCLDPLEQVITSDYQELFAYAGAEHPDDEDDLPQMEGDLLDLEPVIRDAVVLALPFQPVCRTDCPGLCPQCGARLADEPGHEHPRTDPRWSVLHTVYGSEARPGLGAADNEER